ncbi:MAG TPA: GNAT family N-acetyltransferase [Rhizobium sp.]|nr:GNAT family N-acetyltransferase [Rhizobium sp.]
MLSPPTRLIDEHNLDLFESGYDVLDDWLRRRARANQITGASRTYVACANGRVIGYYSLSSGAFAVGEAPGALRRNMPDPTPMAVLGRLAIDRVRQGRGLGVALLQDAVLHAGQAAHIMGSFAGEGKILRLGNQLYC